MYSFDFYTPTRVIFGKGRTDDVATYVKAEGATKVLLHYGSKSAKETGLLARIEKALDEAGISYVELGGVVPNPRLSKVYEGVELCRKEGVDFILAVGGGSVIDSCKAIGYGVFNGGDAWDFYCGKRMPKGMTPLGVVLTLAASGSEMSDSSVITNDDGALKRGCNTEYCRPRFSILDPELTMTLPDYQTACGCTDILMHTMERYFVTGATMEITDEIAEGLMRTVLKNALILKDNPKDYDARAEVMWAGSLSHNGLTGCGAKAKDFASHKIEHEVSGIFDVAHGAGLAAIWGSWARYVISNVPARFARFAEKVMGVVPEGTDEETGLKGIMAMEDFFRAIGMPTSLKELGIQPTEEQIAHMAKSCAGASGGKIGCAMELFEEDIVKIYNMAL